MTSRDFQSIMERASGCDLELLFAEWVYGAAGNEDLDSVGTEKAWGQL